MGKRIDKSRALVSPRLYSLDEALAFLQEYAQSFKAKFDETVDLVLKLGVDPRHSDQLVRCMVPMPAGLGKDVRVAVFIKDERFVEAQSAGADLFGSEELIASVKSGKIDFDICIATPDMMPKIASLGKVLGPKGLMPNPKLGTVSDDIASAIKSAKAGQVECKVEKAGIVHAPVGKLSFTSNQLKSNILAIFSAILNAKPSGAKGIYMQKMFLSTSQGPSVSLDLKAGII